MHVTDDTDALKKEIAFLKSENEKLEKINAALMYRMEEGELYNHAYRSFEQSVMLTEKVNEQTEQIHSVMEKLEQSNVELANAHAETSRVRQRLSDAIESINQAIVLLDSEGSLIFFNRRFQTFWNSTQMCPQVGDNYFKLTQTAKHIGVIRRALPSTKSDRIIYQLANEHWYQLTIRKTQEGGKVILFTDITEVKMAEDDRYKRLVHQKNRLLQSVIDNIDAGILLVNSQNEIEFWNRTFLRQAKLTENDLLKYKSLNDISNKTRLIIQRPPGERRRTQIVSDKLVVEHSENKLLNGSILYTFTNITSQFKYAQSLKENETWMHTITDNIPALIAYIGPNGRFLYTNRGYRDWYGLGEDDLDKLPLERGHLKSIYPRLKEYVERVNSGEIVSFQSEEANSQGQTGYLQKVYLPHFNEDQEIIGHFVLATDVTEQVQNKLKLESAKDELEFRVTERTKELNATNTALQDAIDSKSRFLAALSHDLLQPLSAAILFNESLKSVDDIMVGGLVNSMANSLSDLESLIRTLIDISKLDAGVMQVDQRAVSTVDLFNQLSKEFTQLSVNYDVDFRTHFQHAVVHTDISLLARILRNLLINALKYGAKGKVLFASRRVRGSLKIMVLDQGVGISEQNQELIFKEFKRIENDFNYSQSLGLGLSIVDKISKLLGQKIGVKSKEGVGACFSISVPIVTPISEAGAESEDIQHPIDIPTHWKSKSIWHIDNDKNMRIAMQALFANWDIELDSYASYTQCKAVAGDDIEQCDLMLLDYHLDDENGLDIAKDMKQLYPGVPVIICTANQSKELEGHTKALGLGLLKKPINPIALKLAMTNLFDVEEET